MRLPPPPAQLEDAAAEPRPQGVDGVAGGGVPSEEAELLLQHSCGGGLPVCLFILPSFFNHHQHHWYTVDIFMASLLLEPLPLQHWSLHGLPQTHSTYKQVSSSTLVRFDSPS